MTACQNSAPTGYHSLFWMTQRLGDLILILIQISQLGFFRRLWQRAIFAIQSRFQPCCRDAGPDFPEAGNLDAPEDLIRDVFRGGTGFLKIGFSSCDVWPWEIAPEMFRLSGYATPLTTRSLR